MKLVALRIDEEQKARLEQLAEERDVTLSRAFREGALLYLNDLREKAHKARGGEATFHGLRRDKDGRPLDRPSPPTPGELTRLRSLRDGIERRGLGAIRDAWNAGAASPVVLAALGQWLSVVGQVYGSNPGEPGWEWFLRDYCPGYESAEASEQLRRVIRSAPVLQTEVDVRAVLDALTTGCARLLHDVETQELVRRAVLPAWVVFERASR
jgi:hypothetical protein